MSFKLLPSQKQKRRRLDLEAKSESKDVWCISVCVTLISLMQRIVQTFVSNQWKQLSNSKAEEMSKLKESIKLYIIGVIE